MQHGYRHYGILRRPVFGPELGTDFIFPKGSVLGARRNVSIHPSIIAKYGVVLQAPLAPARHIWVSGWNAKSDAQCLDPFTVRRMPIPVHKTNIDVHSMNMLVIRLVAGEIKVPCSVTQSIPVLY